MLIWDIIRDWFVMNIWGGYTSAEVIYRPHIGNITQYENGEWFDSFLGDTTSLSFLISKENNYENFISLGDWLSTTSTIIVLVAISVALYFLVRYFFRMFAGLLSGR